MKFGVLGPLEISDGSRSIPLHSRKQRILIAVLLCHANQEVSTARLVDALWNREPPPSADENLRVYVHRLRRVLGGDRIVHRRAGYAVMLHPEELDSYRFESLVEEGRRAIAVGRTGDGAEALRQALALWRGSAVADLDEVPMLRQRASQLVEQRLAALELRIDADLTLGRHSTLVAELSALATEHPFREWFHAQLMLALHRSGRHAEALSVYREMRRLLIEDLGLEPSRQLQHLQQAILTGAPELEWPRPWSAMVADQRGRGLPAACTLPTDIADFTGRDEIVERLVELASKCAVSPAVVIAALSGAAGVGKTTLAVHVAHRLRSRFPGGQLYANLGGSNRPLDPATVLGRFLRAIGVEGAAFPHDLDERAEMFRALVADRACLVVLDDAADAHQARPLLPGSGGTVILTSRRPLSDLDGAHRIALEVFDESEAIALLAAVSGAGRPDREPEAAAELVRLCGYLPLAVRITAARLGVHPHWSLAKLAASLATSNRLDQLSTGGLDVRASLSLSYAALSGGQRRAFRLLALLDASDFPAWVCAAATGVDLATAETMVDAIADHHLIEVVGTDPAGQTRYRYHDLVRLYARERARHEDSASERRGAVGRMIAAWLTLAEHAGGGSSHSDLQVAQGTAARWKVAPAWPLDLLHDGQAWLESERGALVAAVRQASAEGLDDLAWELAASVDHFFETRGYFDDWRTTHDAALVSARRAGARRGEALILWRLGELDLILDRYDQTLAHCEQAAAVLERTGDRRARALVLVAAGLAYRLKGQFDRAASCTEEALEVFTEAADRAGLAQALHSLGAIRKEQGRTGEALTYCEHALSLFEEVGDQVFQALASCNLGILHQHDGRLEQAERYLERSLGHARKSGFSQGEAYALCYRGDLHISAGRHPEASAELGAALGQFRQLGDRFGEALTLRGLGHLHIVEGDMVAAHDSITQAHQIWHDLGIPLWRARALTSLGELHEVGGDHEAATTAWSQAHAIFQQLNTPEADEVADRLSSASAR